MALIHDIWALNLLCCYLQKGVGGYLGIGVAFSLLTYLPVGLLLHR